MSPKLSISSLLLMMVVAASARYFRFERGYEYVYKAVADCDLHKFGTFQLKSKISFSPIAKSENETELSLAVYAVTMKKMPDGQESPDSDLDFTKWFSFVTNLHGEIIKVHYPPDEDLTVLGMKKAFASIIFGKLHAPDDTEQAVEHDKVTGKWQYTTEELGHEGPHFATYHAEPINIGVQFTKTRHDHPVAYGNMQYQKVLQYNEHIGVVSHAVVNESFTAGEAVKGYQPFDNYRPVTPVNNFEPLNIPNFASVTSGHASILTRNKVRGPSIIKPKSGLIDGTIHVNQHPGPKKTKLVNDREELKGNLSCLYNQPQYGSIEGIHCFRHMLDLLQRFPDEELINVAKTYFYAKDDTILGKIITRRMKSDRLYLVDAFAELNTKLSIDLLVKFGFKASPEVMRRMFSHFVGQDSLPQQLFVKELKRYAFHPEDFPDQLNGQETRHSALLVLGSYVNMLKKHNEMEEAQSLVGELEAMLGIHDPYKYRLKRSLLSEQEALDHDTMNMILIEALGNAGMDRSYEHIVSYVNVTTVPLLKRSGLHALRFYHHDEAAELLFQVATNDENDMVRYEAGLHYQRHPKAVPASLLDGPGPKNGSLIEDSQIREIDNAIIGPQRRDVGSALKSVFKGFKFNLKSPSMDWRKVLGSTKIGASFGLTVKNGLDLDIAPLEGKMAVDVHDEAYARVHLGFMGKNIDIMLIRVCFQGKAEYNLNILQEFSFDKIIAQIKKYETLIGDTVQAVKDGIKFLNKLINGDINIGDIFQALIDALEALPGKVMDIRKRAMNAMLKIGVFDEDELPPFIRPARNVIVRISTLYNDVRTDVMDFYNKLVETITIIIPRSAKTLFESVEAIINSIKSFKDSPKEAISQVFKSAMNIKTAVMDLLDAKNKTMEACFFLKGNRPYWWDLKSQFVEIFKEIKAAVKTMASGAPNWIVQKVKEKDPIFDFTGGNTSTSELRKKVVSDIQSIITTLTEPFDELSKMIQPFLDQYNSVMSLVTRIKKAYVELKKGYETARQMIDKVFGPKAHKNFPRKTREKGGKCDGDGFYPSLLNNGDKAEEYPNSGLDLLVKPGTKIVAPFAGSIMLTDNKYEVKIKVVGGSLARTEIFLTNIAPNKTIMNPTDKDYVLNQVYAGQQIGVAILSKRCDKATNHIHFAMRKTSPKGVVDPTRFLEPRPVQIPQWVSTCDDYKMVYKAQTIAAGSIIGLAGKALKDKTPQRKPAPTTTMKAKPANKPISPKQKEIQADPKSSLNKMKEKESKGKSPRKTLGFPDFKAFGNKVLEKFKLRDLKMGAIIAFLDELGMDESKVKMAKVIKRIKELIDSKPCFNPHQLTDDQLRLELADRKMKTTGNRKQMVQRIVQADQRCPLMQLKMPKKMYCTFDDHCTGVQCCMNVKVAMFTKAFKAYARFDPCDFKFVLGFENWKYEIQFPVDEFFGHENDIGTGVKLDLLGGVELRVRYKLEKTESEALATFVAAVCKENDPKTCLVEFPLLDEAAVPLPRCFPNGTIVWPDVDWDDFFSTDAIKNRLKEAGKKAAKSAITSGASILLKELGLPADLLKPTGPCPRPSEMTTKVLDTELEKRKLSTKGTRAEKNLRLQDDDFSCSVMGKDFKLLPIPSSLAKNTYYSISNNCMRFDACVDFKIPQIDYTKAFRAYIDLDMCNYEINIGFESFKVNIVIFTYPWGTDRHLKISDNVIINYNIDKDDVKKVFVVTMGIKICTDADCIVNVTLLTKKEILQPFCNENFTFALPGNGSISGFLHAMGGEMSMAAFNVILKQFKLDEVLLDGQCVMPTMAPKSCPWSLNLDFLPTSVKKLLNCKLADNCFGIDCCIELPFKLPLVKKAVYKNIRTFFQFEPCDFTFEAAFGPWKYKTKLISYDWGKQTSLTIGSGNPPPIDISFIIDKDDAAKSFILSLNVTVCLDIDGTKICIPDENGFKLMDKMVVPLCDANAIAGIVAKFRNASVKDWAKAKGIQVGKKLAAAGIDQLLTELGIKPYLKTTGQCDSKRAPYVPAVNGWKNDCPKSIFKLPKLPSWMTCHLVDTCSGIECCADVDFYGMYTHSFTFYLILDTCDYVFKTGFEKLHFSYTLFSYDWGKPEKVNLMDMFKISYSIGRIPERKKFILNADLCVSFGKNDVCDLELKMLKDTEVPQFLCDMSANFTLPSGSSVKEFMKEQGGKLAGQALDAALRALGLGAFIGSTGLCPNKGKPIQNSCPYIDKYNITLPTLPDSISCAINYQCLGVECCASMDLGFLQRSFRAWAIVDPCDYKLSVGFEGWEFNMTLFTYDWGKNEKVKLGDHMAVLFSIGKSKTHYTINLAVTANIPDFPPMDIKVLKDYKFPIPFCDPNATFVLPYKNWDAFKKDVGGQAGEYAWKAALKFLGLQNVVDGNLCTLAPVAPNNSAICPHLKMPKLPKWAQCTFDDMCFGIKCCVELDFKVMKKSLTAWAIADTCDYAISAGFEKFSYNKSLSSSFWGQEMIIDVSDYFKIFFTVDKDTPKKMLKFDLSLAMKLDQVVNYKVLNNFEMPQPLCNPDFDLGGTIADFKEQAAANFKGMVTEQILKRIGLSMDFFDMSACPIPKNAVSSSSCPHFTVPSWLPENVRCQIQDNCLGMTCCVTLKVLSFEYTFKARVFFDPCNYTFNAQVENWKYQKYIFENFGFDREVMIFNALGLRFKLVSGDKGDLLVTLDIKVCMDGQCSKPFNLLKDTRLPLPYCKEDGTLVWPKVKPTAEEMKQWLSQKSKDAVTDLIGLGPNFFRKDVCAVPANTKCPYFQLPNLPKSINCVLSSYCTGVECCLDVDLKVASWSFKAWAMLDPCDFVFSFGFENWQFNDTLFSYSWGTPRTVDIAKTISVTYTIDKSADNKNFEMSVSFSVRAKDDLIIPDFKLLKKAIVPIPFCNQEGGKPVLEWATPDEVFDSASGIVLTRLGLDANLLHGSGCHKLNNTNAKTCPYFTLPALPKPVSCIISDKCTGIECCVTLDLKVVKRSFKAWLKIDPCDFKFSIGFEKWTLNVTLFSYAWGVEKTEKIGSAVNMKYIVDKTVDQRDFIFTLKVDLCLDDVCADDIVILNAVTVPIPFCNMDGTFQWPSISVNGLAKAASGLVLNRLGVAMDELFGEECTPPQDNSDTCPSFSLPSLPSAVKCRLTDFCTGVECCATLDLKVVSRNFKIWAMIDPCQLSLSIGFEREYFNMSIGNGLYTWGKTKTLTIGNMNIHYSVDHSPDNGKFILTLAVELCLDGSCVTLNILKGAQIPVPFCHNNGTISWPDDLTMKTVLMNIMGVSSDFFKKPACVAPLPDPDKSCRAVSLPAFAQSACKLTDSCMGVQCCFDYDFKISHFQAYAFFDLNYCINQLSYGLENKVWTFTMISFGFGVEHTQNIGDELTLTYTIWDNINRFTASLKVSICISSNTCFEKVILDKTDFLKPGCSRRRREALPYHHPERRALRSKSVDLTKLDDTPDDDIDTIVKRMQAENKTVAEIKAHFMAAAAARQKQGLVVNDNTPTGYRSRMSSMAGTGAASFMSGNRDTSGKFNITGADEIKKMLGSVTEIVGRAAEAFTPGAGLTQAGLDLLGSQLADMTVGDIEAMLDTQNLDPVVVILLMKDLKELFVAIYNELVDAFLSAMGGEFSALDITLKGDVGFPKKHVTFFEYKQFFMVGGLVPMTFQFGTEGYYGAEIELGAKVLEMMTFGAATPFVGVNIYGELGIGFLLYGKLRFVGSICELHFPTYAEIYFNKFPMDVGLKMDLVVIPLTLKLIGLVTLEVDLGPLGTIKKTLFSVNIFEYRAPSITTNIFNVHTKDEDKTPPAFSKFSSNKITKRNAEAVSCEVSQVAGRDYTEPAFEIAARAEDDKSQVKLLLDVGTVPGGSDLLSGVEVGGQSSVITTVLNTHGIPVHFKITGSNSASDSSYVTCSIPTYDKTPPTGRLREAFKSTSNTRVAKASLLALEDSVITESKVAVGFGRGMYGDQIKHWREFSLDAPAAVSSDSVMDKFTAGVAGRLIAKIHSTSAKPDVITCASSCMNLLPTQCLSFNFDYGDTGSCELLEGIENTENKIGASGHFFYFERLNIGKDVNFDFTDVYLEHNNLYFFNVEMVNNLGYTNIISTDAILVDLSPPGTGLVKNAKSDDLEQTACAKLIPPNRKDWLPRCSGSDTTIKNHRTVVDGEGSKTVFNGYNAMKDMLYTRSNRFIATNWDGFHDNDTGILGYTWGVGKTICSEEIAAHSDPQSHLSKTEWTYSGTIHPKKQLADGRYYSAVRSLNNVEYGGPLATTVCHSTPLSIDNTPPIFKEIYDVDYDEETFVITAKHSVEDPESGIHRTYGCLGRTTKDCDLSAWTLLKSNDMMNFTFQIPNGVSAWPKLKAENHVDLSTTGTTKTPILVDTTPPIAGMVYDGDQTWHQRGFTMNDDKACASWKDFTDPESGIAYYQMAVRDVASGKIVVNQTDFRALNYKGCIDLVKEGYPKLSHGSTYKTSITAWNGAIRQLFTKEESTGIKVDLTPPVMGDVVDGNLAGFHDVQFSSQRAEVSAQWRNFNDPESNIIDYEAQVEVSPDGKQPFKVNHAFESVYPNKNFIMHHFNLAHKSHVKTKLRATNGAYNTDTATSNGFVVDLTPPVLDHIGDGSTPNNDINFQSTTNDMSVNFGFHDDESGVKNHKVKLYQVYEKTKTLIAESTELPSSQGVFTKTGLDLKNGATYFSLVTSSNNAEPSMHAMHKTTGFKIDKTPPDIVRIYVGVVTGMTEEKYKGKVLQSDKKGITASWLAIDGESGVEEYRVCVGLSNGTCEVSDWRSMGKMIDGYIDNLTLELSNNTRFYYVSVKAVNGAGLCSDVVTGTPIKVVKADKAGHVIDGADGTEVEPQKTMGVDMDYTLDDHTVTVQFEGFESKLFGIKHMEWAIGSSPFGEELQTYMREGIVLRNDDSLLNGNEVGQIGAGKASAPIDLEPQKKYYASVRATTYQGKTLESTSDGFLIDQKAPEVVITGLGLSDNQTSLAEGKVIYQLAVDSLSGAWEYKIDQNTSSPIIAAMYSFSTYPGGHDIRDLTNIGKIYETHINSVAAGVFKPVTDGRANILEVYAVNAVGLIGTVTSAAIVVDATPPVCGTVTCPSTIQAVTELECSWKKFYEEQSLITSFSFAIGTARNVDDIYSFRALPAYKEKHLATHFDKPLENQKTYYVTVRATNSLGLTCESFSDPIKIDDTPPTAGVIVELSHTYHIDFKKPKQSKYDIRNKRTCDSEAECEKIDAVCQNSVTQVSVAWTPFTDKQTDIVSCYLAIGRSPGGSQIKPFIKVPVTANNFIVDNLYLGKEKQIFATIKAYNGAGMSATATSNGVSLSYVTQGLPPLSNILVSDGTDVYNDLDYQESESTISASWDFSGDPCPMKSYEWSIVRLDGVVMQNYTDTAGKTTGINDNLKMKEGELYYVKVRAINQINQVLIKRSNGVTIRRNPLRPGRVSDGDVNGYDLMYLPSTSEVSANWDGFGDGKVVSNIPVVSGNDGVESKHQTVSYYEVAVGTDRRFSHTRNNIVPFTNVGLNNTVTFKDLQLTGGKSMYFFTVRAYSTSKSMAEVTSNGFYAGYDTPVTPSTISSPESFWSDKTNLAVQWDKFTSGTEVGMAQYSVGVSNKPLAQFDPVYSLRQLLALDKATKSRLFPVVPLKNVQLSTVFRKSGLNLVPNHLYYAIVIGMNGAGKCNMTEHAFRFDETPPTPGEVKVGPYWNMRAAYTNSLSTIDVEWRNFADPESGLRRFDISLWTSNDCGKDHLNSLTVYKDWFVLPINATSYKFVDLELRMQQPYYVKLRAVNKANLKTEVTAAPVLLDSTLPTAGTVVDGPLFKQDVVWVSQNDKVLGNLLHYPTNAEDPCPNRDMPMDLKGSWGVMGPGANLEVNNTQWGVQYFRDNVESIADGDGLRVTMRRQDGNEMSTGGFFRNAEIARGGRYQIAIKATSGKAVTSVVFWDGEPDSFGDYNYVDQPLWAEGNCKCCLEKPIPSSCVCNCTTYLANQAYYKNLTQHAAAAPSEDAREKRQEEVILYEGNGVRYPTQRACGFQLVGDAKPFAVLWCSYANDSQPVLSQKRHLLYDPTADYHQYTIDVYYRDDDPVNPQWCFSVKNKQLDLLIGEVCGIEEFSSNTIAIFHVFNRDNFISPDLSYKAVAQFKGFVMPPSAQELCRYGKIFQGGETAIISYEAGIGTNASLTNIAAFKKVATPCVPCVKSCDVFTCNKSCPAKSISNIQIQLDGLSLKVDNNKITSHGKDGKFKDKLEIMYYLTVKALLGSGAYIIQSSSGFYIDTTPPVLDSAIDVMYIDVKRGAFEPVHYQKSQDTIKVIWKCEDSESGIKENSWAIGTKPGQTDIQGFTSVGTLGTGTKTGLVLFNQQAYFVTITCINHAGLELRTVDQKGVTVLLGTPNIDDVKTTLTQATAFNSVPPIYPSGAMQTDDPTKAGATWSKASDTSVARYEFCIGTSLESIEDVFPCSWLAVNTSGRVDIKDGHVYLNNVKGKPLSHYVKPDEKTNMTALKKSLNIFEMEPGRNFFTKMKICNEAYTCRYNFVGSTTVVESGNVIHTQGGSSETSLHVGKDQVMPITTGFQTGQSFTMGVIDSVKAKKNYGSDAVVDFVPYITDPQANIDLTETDLKGRIITMPDTSFFISPVGQAPFKSALNVQIKFPSSKLAGESQEAMLLHWDPSELVWMMSATCRKPPTITQLNDGNLVSLTAVCKTRMKSQQPFFSVETQFIFAIVRKTSYEIEENENMVDEIKENENMVAEIKENENMVDEIKENENMVAKKTISELLDDTETDDGDVDTEKKELEVEQQINALEKRLYALRDDLQNQEEMIDGTNI